ncbi:MAG: N-acetylmuramoyl-L-alanine amidase, partial [Bacteroidetes bacterium]|nr:N-acetylmuramoyl-L-alanine amidase [Bacteroidota bacterium]
MAKEGDGIWMLLRRFGLEPSEYMQAFLELNQANIGKDNSLYAGRVYHIPAPKTEEAKPETTPSSAPS